MAAVMVSATAVSISWSTRFFILFLWFFLVVAAYTAPVFVSSFEEDCSRSERGSDRDRVPLVLVVEVMFLQSMP